MASLGLGDVGADVRSRSVGAAASHFYCSIDKIGQVAVASCCWWEDKCCGSMVGCIGCLLYTSPSPRDSTSS
eukprot:172526-Prorocentrum_lima.AAC.1